MGAPEAVSADDGVAADVPVGRPDLRQLHPGLLSEPKDRRALADDQFGRDLFRGVQEGLGITANMIVADIAIDADMSIDTQVDILKNSGAEVLVLNCAPPISARAIRRAAELDWHPVLLLVNAAASIANALRPAGLQNSVGVISTSFLKDASDTTWKEDSAVKDWLAFMDKYYPDGDKEHGNA